MATIRLDGLKKSFGKTEVIHGVDIDIADGDDFMSLDDDRLPGQHPVSVHRQDIDIDERGRRRDCGMNDKGQAHDRRSQQG